VGAYDGELYFLLFELVDEVAESDRLLFVEFVDHWDADYDVVDAWEGGACYRGSYAAEGAVVEEF
jgi:hypothetical protein